MNFTNLLEAKDFFAKEENCIELLMNMRWPDRISCVFCNHTKIYNLRGPKKRFKCADCSKSFSLTKGTIFENSQIPLEKWFFAIYIMSSHKKGISSVQLSKDIGVTQKSAWFMLHRIRYAFQNESYFKQLDGIVQCDEVYIGGKNKNRHGYKKIKGSQGRSAKDKTPVFGMIKTGGRVFTSVVPNTQAKTLKPIIKQMVKEGSIVVTDEFQSYKNMPKEYYHVSVNHKQKEYVRGEFHTNSIEGFWSLLKRGIFGIYHYVSPKHLDRYCNEFSYRYNTRQVKCHERFYGVLERINCRLKLNELIDKEAA